MTSSANIHFRADEHRLRALFNMLFPHGMPKTRAAVQKAYDAGIFDILTRITDPDDISWLSGRLIGRDGDVVFYQDGLLHRGNDLPAIICPYRMIVYCQHGARHRDNGPAALYDDGTQCFYRNGKLHRDGDFPAIIHGGGTLEFYKDGRLWREDGKPTVLRPWEYTDEEFDIAPVGVTLA